MKAHKVVVLLSLITLSLFISSIGNSYSSIPQPQPLYPEEPKVPDQVLNFLRDVVKLDMTKYSVNNAVGPNTVYWDDMNGLPETNGKFTLGTIEVLYVLVNNVLRSMLLYLDGGTPLFSQPMTTNPKELAIGFLDSYQTFTGNPDISTMRAMVDYIDMTKNSSVIADNILQQVYVSSDRASFSWQYTYNGAIYSHIVAYYQNGFLIGFRDDTSYLKIGGTDVSVTREQAVNIALDRAENYTYRTYEGEVIRDFVFVNNQISAQLLTRGRDNPLVLYPYWLIQLPLATEYPDYVNVLEVTLWADTGKIIEIFPLEGGGSLPSNDTSNDPSQSGSTDSQTIPPNTMYIQLGDKNNPLIAFGVIATAFMIPIISLLIGIQVKKRKVQRK